jgi:predicted phage-related endonuclease
MSDVDVHPVTDACWDVERPKLLNASENGCLFGVHAFTTLARLTAEKRGLVKNDVDPEHALIRRGHALEDDTLDEVRKLRPTWRITPGTKHYVDRKDRLGAIPDAIVEAPERQGLGVLQAKVVSRPVFRRQWPDETPPLSYLLQLAQEMMLVGAEWGAIGALVIGDFSFDAHVFEVTRDHKAEGRLREAAAKFWRAFDAGDIPTVDFERDGDLIALLYPAEVTGKIVDLTTDNVIGELLERRQILKDTEKDICSRLEATEAEIKAKLGDAERALVPGWHVTLKLQHRKAHHVKASSFRMLRASREQPREDAAS